MTVYAMRKGTAPNPTINATYGDSGNNVSFDCPTNPMFVDSNAWVTTHRIFAYVSTDDSHSETFVQQLQGSDTANTEYNNLVTTKGYRIKCYDDVSQTGIKLDGLHTEGDPETRTHDYFVLIHSDDVKKHHFARITEVKNDDVYGDTFEFEPRLGTQISKNVKFQVFRGPTKTETTIVGVAAGLRAQEFTTTSTYSLNKALICARPLFYFYNDRLDKKNELDHDKKHFLKYKMRDLSTGATVNTFDTNCFITTQDFNFRIKDYSRYTIKALLEDNLRPQDDPRLVSTNDTDNEGQATVNTGYSLYDQTFHNIRRDSNDLYTDGDNYVGPYRYTHYNFSPAKGNQLPNVLDINTFESVGGRGGYAEFKAVDSLRILPSKVKEFDQMRIRHQVHRGHFYEFFALKATVKSNVSGNEYTFDTTYDLDDFFAVGDEVKVGDRILIVQTIDSHNPSTDEQDITFRSENRLETETSFNTNAYSLSANDRLFRRAWSQSKGTLLTTFPIIENRHHNLRVLLIEKGYEVLEATVTASNKLQKTLTLSFDSIAYGTSSSLDHVSGDYMIEIERFDGEIEQIDITKEHGQHIMNFYGRNTYSKLISPIINKDTLFSRDVIYSSNSPSNFIEKVGVGSVAFNLGTITLTTVDLTPVANDKLFIKYDNNSIAYISDVTSYDSGTKIISLDHMPLTEGTSAEIWRAKEKNYVFNKALSANNRLSEFATSLTGSAEKGIFFESGTNTSNTSLVRTSKSTNDKAIGYHIHHPSNISKDEHFQSRLSDGGSSFFTDDVVNSLMDFTVLNIATVDDKTTIEIAPYVPLTLGRMDYNDFDNFEVTLVDVGTTTGSGSHASNSRYVELTATPTTTISEKDSIYIDGVFVGYCAQVVKPTTSANWRVYLDRSVDYSASSKLQLQSTGSGSCSDHDLKFTHDLYLTNGAHLHGGKFVSLLHPMLANGKPTYFNMPSPYSQATSAERFGNPIYKLNHIERGQFSYEAQDVTVDGDKYNGNYYKNSTKLNYYANGYKLNAGRFFNTSVSPNVYKEGIVRSRLKETSHPHLPIENRGYKPASGSLYFDYDIFESGHTKDTIIITSDPTTSGATSKSRYVVKDILEQFDGSVSRLFLFSNSDLMPHSSTRSDSLLNSNRDLKQFKLLLLNEPSKDENTTIKHSQYSGSGQPRKYLDTDYESITIESVDVSDITKLKRFGLMRLTEVVFDCLFNQFNPEKPPPKTRVLPQVIYHYHAISSLSVTVSSYGATSIVVSSAITVNDDDILVDSNGDVIGVVNGNHASQTTINLDSAPVPTNNGNEYTGTLYKATAYSSAITGHGDGDTFVSFSKDINLLRGIIHSDDFYTASGTAFEDIFKDRFDAPNNITATLDSNLVLPIAFDTADFIGNNITGHPNLLFKQWDALPFSNASDSTKDFLDNVIHGVCLDRFNIEETDGAKVSAGTCFPPVENTHIRNYTHNTSPIVKTTYTINMGLQQNFATYKDGEGTSYSGADEDGDGAIIGFKVRVRIENSWESTINGPAGTTLYKYTINDSDAQYLSYVKDLTGCYLASEAGEVFSTEVDTNTSETLCAGINDVIPTTLGYILSHEIDTSNATKRHIIVSDTQLATGNYRLMQPNETTFYDYSPTEININTLSSKYTKMGYKNEMYDSMRDYLLLSGSGDRQISGVNNHGHNEAVLSMYVVADLDVQDAGVGGKTHIVQRTPLTAAYTFWNNTDDYILGDSKNICVTDGSVSLKTSVTGDYLSDKDSPINNSDNGFTLNFGELKEMQGVVSVSQIMTITTPQNVKGRGDRALIGSVVSICDEVENQINNLLEENDLEFTTDYTDDYPLFLAPNYQSVDLFSAINYLTERKDKTLIYENNKFTLRDKDNSNNFSSMIITDRNNKYQIKDFTKSDVLFDFYNEIIVYGLAVKSTKQNLRSIKKRGRKTLEIYDQSLVTQEDVDERASELLRLHSRLNQKVTLEIGHQNISQLRAGDIVSLELLQDNIELAQYLILEMKHTIDGFIKMELGRFSKGLEDRFAELLIDSAKNKALIRPKQFKKGTTSIGELVSVQPKEVKLLIRKRAVTGGSAFNIGFSTAIGFTTTMGFGSSGATTTITTLREVEL